MTALRDEQTRNRHKQGQAATDQTLFKRNYQTT